MADKLNSPTRYQTADEAEESFLALVRALRAIRPDGAAHNRPARRAVSRDEAGRPTSASSS